MWTRELQRRLEEKGVPIIVIASDPGGVHTGMFERTACDFVTNTFNACMRRRQQELCKPAEFSRQPAIYRYQLSLFPLSGEGVIRQRLCRRFACSG